MVYHIDFLPKSISKIRIHQYICVAIYMAISLHPIVQNLLQEEEKFNPVRHQIKSPV